MTLARIHHMKRILLLLILGAPLALPADLTVVLTALRGHLYVVEDNFYLKENSMVYVGDNFVTVIGATWIPETAKLLAAEVKKVYSQTDYGSNPTTETWTATSISIPATIRIGRVAMLTSKALERRSSQPN